MTDLNCRKISMTETLSSSSAGSSPVEEERLKCLFMSCDSNNDGLLDRTDLVTMCEKLNMSELAEEIICALGANISGNTISFAQFLRCRAQVLRGVESGAIEAEYLHYYNDTKYDQVIGSWSDLSQIYSSADYDSGTHDTTNRDVEEPLSIFAMIHQSYPELYTQWTSFCRTEVTNTIPQQILQCANHIHLARINRLYVELKLALKRINSANASRDLCQKEVCRTLKERDKLKSDLQNQTSRYEDRLTELHSVIAELQKKNERKERNTIPEEDEEEGINVEDYERLNANNQSHWNGKMHPSSTISLLDNSTCILDQSMIIEPIHDTYVDSETQRDGVTRAEYQGQDGPITADMEEVVEKQLATFHHNNIYLQQKLSDYETVVSNTRAQLEGVIAEREVLRKQLKELQECTELTNTPIMAHGQHVLSCSGSKLSMDSKSTNSYSSPSPAVSRPMMGVRQQSKQIQMKSQIQEPEWVSKVVTKYQQNIDQNNHSVHNMITNSFKEDSNRIQTSGLLFLQELAELVPYPSMMDPCRRICLEWQRLVAITDRESSGKLLLQNTLSETKSIADQLQCSVMQLQSDCAVLAKCNQLADQIIELADIMIQLQETDLVTGVVDLNHHSMNLEPAYQNSSIIMNQHNDVSQLRLGYREQLESAAKLVLYRLECYGSLGRQTPDSGAGVSSTLSSGGGSLDVESVLRQTSGAGDWTKTDEVKLRRLLDQLIASRSQTRLSVVSSHQLGQSYYGQCFSSSNHSSLKRTGADNLSSFNLDPSMSSSHQQLIESAILIQEVCTLKEERATLKTSIYLLEKEIKALQLGLESRIAAERSLKIQLTQMMQHRTENISSPITDESRKFKTQVNDLLQVLDEMRERYQVQQQQNEEFVDDLKRANAALIAAFDRAKKKYQSKISRLEQQISNIPRPVLGSVSDETAL